MQRLCFSRFSRAIDFDNKRAEQIAYEIRKSAIIKYSDMVRKERLKRYSS